MNATLGHDQQLEFESDQNLIKLDIPPEGTTTSDEGWRITPLGSAVVGLAVTTFLTRLHAHLIYHTVIEEWGVHSYNIIKMCSMCIVGVGFYVNFLYVHYRLRKRR